MKLNPNELFEFSMDMVDRDGLMSVSVSASYNPGDKSASYTVGIVADGEMIAFSTHFIDVPDYFRDTTDPIVHDVVAKEVRRKVFDYLGR